MVTLPPGVKKIFILDLPQSQHCRQTDGPLFFCNLHWSSWPPFLKLCFLIFTQASFCLQSLITPIMRPFRFLTEVKQTSSQPHCTSCARLWQSKKFLPLHRMHVMRYLPPGAPPAWGDALLTGWRETRAGLVRGAFVVEGGRELAEPTEEARM